LEIALCVTPQDKIMILKTILKTKQREKTSS